MVNYYLEHKWDILGSALAYYVLQLLSPTISRLILKKNYTNLDRKERINFDIHVVAMIQCLVSIMAIIPLIGDEHLQQDSVRNYTPYAAFVSSITIGYFLWDSYVCLRYYSLFGIGFLLHAFASLFVFSQTLRPFCLGWVASFLSFELSTPFVNINWFITKLPAHAVPLWFQVANGVILIVVFFSVRIVWGFYAIFLVCKEFYYVDDYPKWLLATLVMLNLGLDCLNVFWFSKMIRIATKKFNGAKSETKKQE